MNRIEDRELDNIIGGDTISGTVINAFANIIELLLDAGRRVGSAIRRVSEGNLCPLE